MSDTEQKPSTEMDFFEHLSELRYRLLIIFGSIALFSIGGFLYSQQAFAVLSKPFFEAFPDDILIGTGPAEAFILRIKLSLFLGFLVSLPVLFFQLWLFIAPGLHQHERRLAIPFIIVTSLLFLIGVWFCYAVVLSFAFEFFRAQYDAIGNVTPTIRVSEYISLLLKALFGFGLIFETPVLAYFLGRLGLIDHKDLLAWGRYAIIIIFIISAILTPPDIITQFLMAGPLMLLYAGSIVLVRFTHRKDRSPILDEDS